MKGWFLVKTKRIPRAYNLRYLRLSEKHRGIFYGKSTNATGFIAVENSSKLKFEKGRSLSQIDKLYYECNRDRKIRIQHLDRVLTFYPQSDESFEEWKNKLEKLQSWSIESQAKDVEVVKTENIASEGPKESFGVKVRVPTPHDHSAIDIWFDFKRQTKLLSIHTFKQKVIELVINVLKDVPDALRAALQLLDESKIELRYNPNDTAPTLCEGNMMESVDSLQVNGETIFYQYRVANELSECYWSDTPQVDAGELNLWLSDESQMLQHLIPCLPTKSQNTICLMLLPTDLKPKSTLRAVVLGSQLSIDGKNNRVTKYRILVTHENMQWIILRRYSEFCSMHKSLQYSSVKQLPSFPSKQFLKAHSNSERIIESRKVDLGNYLQSLLKLEVMSLSPPPSVLSFLGLLSTSRHIEFQEQNEPTEVMHLSKVLQTLQYGDVIMFKCVHPVAGLQRKVTQSSWDHIAIVAPDGGLLEATAEGCFVYPLESRLKAYGATGFASAIGIRMLQMQRTEATYNKFKSFVKRVHGHPYSLSFSKLIFTKLKNETESNTDSHTEPTSFFCSELVAEGLSILGVLKSRKTASYYWPASFAEGQDIDNDIIVSSLNTKGETKAFLKPIVFLDCNEPEVKFSTEI